ncbi:Na/Pi cotransporter family protein [Massilibacterium senegalense]|uniref:Na/Pi cotransporter family protein n=1 Tax=Massilibacterium senegalense TaxID=1632858 RepID=UPI000785AB15|nr:Na/Pi cotransporter family protein [Massilibacterium senegalense]
MEVDVQRMIFEFIGGLGIFLFGIKFMGDGLQKAAGNRLREILDKYTSNPLMGVLAGIIVTALIQSSSATTVLTVGLVNAGFMTLRQAIGIIMGANIGTTVTAFIIGVDVAEYSLPIIAVGALLIFFFNNAKANAFGQVIFGFGALFYGLETMGEGMKPLREFQVFQDLMVDMSHSPVLGVMVGTIFTLIVQSSSATIGILQQLFDQQAISLQAALPVLFGDNIGTTITAVLASLGATIAARRAALTHVLFNIIGTVVFLLILGFYTDFIQFIQTALDLNRPMTIAFAHGTFNITNTIIQFPFIGFLALIVTKLIPGEETIIDSKPHHLDPVFIEKSPSIALGQAKQEVIRMAEFSKKGLEEAHSYLKTNQKKHLEVAKQIEEAINNLDRKITDYLVKVSAASLAQGESEFHFMLMNSVRDIERVGDHVENITELSTYKFANKVRLSEQAEHELDEMFYLALSMLEEVIESLQKSDREKAKLVLLKEEQIDTMERTLRKQHIQRLNEGACSGSAGIVFVDIISNLERIGDHASNIAQEIID